jgi:transposase
MTKQDLNYWMMYHEVHHLKRQGCSLRKISEELVLNFRTVRKYLLMSEEEFFKHLEDQDRRYKKLSPYEEFVKGKLGLYPETKSAQMHDWLKEHNPDFPEVCEKTVFNFVQYIRQKYNIPQQYESRQFFPVEEMDYGSQAQADLGEYTMRMTNGNRKKVHFFTMVLSRSRHKYGYFSIQPFTTQMSIIAHEKAFTYFQGIPQEVVYDQDRLLLNDENKGDLLLTREFKAYTIQRGFRLYFCRKADPQSKGKIENVIRYFKQNFLYNRVFIDIDTLNDQVLEWLSRTANIMVHHSTRKVPFYEWHIEKNYLKAFTPVSIDCNPYVQYCVRKDNTIAYKGNFYTLPEGTYKNKDTVVLLRSEEEKLCIYSLEKAPICSHQISTEKGKVIRNTDHKRDKSLKISQMVEQIAGLFEESSVVKDFLEKVHQTKPRYIRDQLVSIRSMIIELGVENVSLSICYCMENNIYDAASLKSVAYKYVGKQKQTSPEPGTIKLLTRPENQYKANIKPMTSNIEDYEKIVSN